jgi:hypothetical protein
MAQAGRKHNRSVWSLAREWRQTHLKMQYELSLIDEDDDGIDLVADIGQSALQEIEARIVSAPMTTLAEAQVTINIAVGLLHDNVERSERLLRAVHRGLNRVRDANGRAEA